MKTTLLAIFILFIFLANIGDCEEACVFKQEPNTITLKLNGPPVQCGQNFVCLIGILKTKRNSFALIEVNGKGYIYTIGEEINDFKITRIKRNEVLLWKKS
jgi:type II secretory pathway component PulC